MNAPKPPPSDSPQQQCQAAARAAATAADLSMRSAVDGWLVALLIGSILAVLYLAGQSLAQAPLQAVVALVMAFVACSVVLMRGVPCRYALSKDALLIRSGIEHRRIPYAEIQRVESIWSPMGATAWSAKRLRIKHHKGIEQISPVDREQFMRTLSERIRPS